MILVVCFSLLVGFGIGYNIGSTFGSIDGLKDWLCYKGILYRVFMYQQDPEVYTYKYRLTLNSAVKCATQWWCKERVANKPYSAYVSVDKKLKNQKHCEKMLELEL